MEKTKNYDMFVFRKDNRQRLDAAHIQKLVQSIKARNLLELRPIIVNEAMEIIDGQHRLMAAKALGVDIYYQKEAKLDAADIIKINLSKSWNNNDYFNYYCQHEYPEYIKLREFIKKNEISLRVALKIVFGQMHKGFQQFRKGEFKFNSEVLDRDLSICWDTILHIKKINGHSPYTSSSRFWQALLLLIKHPHFDEKKWHINLRKMVSHFSPKANTEDYVAMVQNIYNFRSTMKIQIDMDEKEVAQKDTEF